jgi:hypothetical protein
MKDVISMASIIGNSSMDRLSIKNPRITKKLQYLTEETVITPQMQEDLRRIHLNMPNLRYFTRTTSETGFGAYRNRFGYSRSNSYSNSNPSFERGFIFANNLFNRNAGSRSNQFFQGGGGESGWDPSSPQGLTSRISEEEDKGGEFSGVVVPEEINIPYGEGVTLGVFIPGWEVEIICREVALYWGSFVGIVWNYAKLYKQIKSDGLLEKKQEILRISWIKEDAGNLRSKVRGFNQAGNGRGDIIRGSSLD